MIKEIITRFKQGYRTIKFPKSNPPALPDRLRGLPVIDRTKCFDDCNMCVDVCPTDAINKKSIDLGKCIFCTDCIEVCQYGAINFTNDYRLAVKNREDLILKDSELVLKIASNFDKKIKSMFGRSLKLREVSAGGCNACEADCNVLTTIGWDLSRFGIQFVASPRHADGLLITGPVTKNMELALIKTYEAVPEPKIVIAVGACAISGGPFISHKEINNGADSIVPVDLYVPGCPPHPLTILDGLLRIIGRIKK